MPRTHEAYPPEFHRRCRLPPARSPSGPPPLPALRRQPSKHASILQGANTASRTDAKSRNGPVVRETAESHERREFTGPFLLHDVPPLYAGEFMIATGLGTDTWFAPNTEDLKRHYEEIRDYATNYDNGKMPYDFDVAYDIAAINDAVSRL